MTLIEKIREDMRRDREWLKNNPPQPHVIDASAIKLLVFILGWSAVSLIAITLLNS